MATKNKDRPKPVVFGNVTITAIREPDSSGRWYWRARRSVGEQRETLWTGRAHRDEVEALFLDAQKDIKTRTDSTTGRVAQHWTLGDLLAYYVGDNEDRVGIDLDVKTVESRRNAWKRLKPICDLSTDRLSAEPIEKYVRQRLRDGAAPGTVTLDLTTLRMAWQWGREREYIADRPMPKVRLPKADATPKRTPTDDEVALVLAEVDRSCKPWVGRGLRLHHATGARLEELARLTWSDIHLDDGYLHIRHGKGGRQRDVYLAPQVIETMRQWKEEDGDAETPWMGTAPTTYRAMSKVWRRAAQRVGIDGFAPHALRRAAAGTYLRAGVHVGVAAAQLGHSAAMLLKTYYSPTDADRRNAANSASLGVIHEGGEVIKFARR